MDNKIILIKCFNLINHSQKSYKAFVKNSDEFIFIPKSVIVNYNKVTKNLQIQEWFAKQKNLI